MAWWRAIGGELSALGTLALSMPLGLLLPHQRVDPTAPHPIPVVFVHGVCGTVSNFLVLRTFLEHHGLRNFASLSYVPRVDYQRRPCQLARRSPAASTRQRPERGAEVEGQLPSRRDRATDRGAPPSCSSTSRFYPEIEL